MLAAMRLRIAHTTTYRYEPAASGVIQILRMTPSSHDGQYVAQWQIDVSTDSKLDVHEDAFGNVTHVLTYGQIADLTIQRALDVTAVLARFGSWKKVEYQIFHNGVQVPTNVIIGEAGR